jgi:hypothetical protein
MSLCYIVSFLARILATANEPEIVRSLNALSKLCIIRLSAETVHFIVPGNEGREGVQVWS